MGDISNTKFTIEVTAKEISRRYLAENGMVAINRELANLLAKSDGGVASHLMIYAPRWDEYIPSDEANALLRG